MNWDWLITATILITLGLAIWAKVSRQTIPELLGNIREMFTNTEEDVVDEVENYSLYK